MTIHQVYVASDSPIPPVTDSMGRFWQQPDRDSIIITDEVYALMSQATFDALATYSGTIPTGVYGGKMWKREERGSWFLLWFHQHPQRPDLFAIATRKITIMVPS